MDGYLSPEVELLGYEASQNQTPSQRVAALPLSLRKASGFPSMRLAFLEALPRAA